MPREVIYFGFLFCAILSSLSMAEAAVAIPLDVLEAARPAVIPLPEPPASDESPALPAQKAVCFLSLFLWWFAPSICCVCYAELTLAMVVLVNIHHLFRGSRSICLLSCFVLWRVVLACKVSFLAYAIFLMVFRFWPYVLSKLVFMG